MTFNKAFSVILRLNQNKIEFEWEVGNEKTDKLTIQNLIDLTNRIKDIILPENAKLISFEV